MSETERFPEFPRAEYEGRWERGQRLLAESGLDALLVTSEQNYRYLSGHTTQFWVSKTRPLFCILPRRGQSTLVLTTSQEGAARATSWVDDVRAYPGFVPELVDRLAETLRDVGLSRARIGAELGEEQRLGLPYLEFQRLQQSLPGAAFVNAAGLLWRLRQVKSPAEIECLRRAAHIGGQAYREVFGQVHEGMTQREIYGLYVASTFRLGAERQGYLCIVSGNDHRHYHAGPSDQALRRGDLLWMDGGCVYRGYWSDFSRMVAIGQATEQQRQRYRAVRALTQRSLRAARPGMTIASLMQSALAEAEQLGLELSVPSRIGHGTGLDITEPPSINLADTTVIQPGMVLNIEPTSATPFGVFQTEEIVAVAPDGIDLLTEPAPEDLPIAS